MRKYLWLLTFAVCIVLVIFLTRKLTIGKVSCKSQYNVCSPKLYEAVTSVENTSFFSGRKKLTEMLRNDKSISSFSVRYSPPVNLIVYVLEKKGDVAIRKDEDEKFTVLTKGGEPVAESSEIELPKIVVKGGPIFPDETLFAVSTMYELFKYYGIKESLVSPDGMTFEYKGYKIIFPLEGDIDVLLGSTELTLSWLNTSPEVSTIEGGLSEKTIDFRYKNPVVK